MRFVATVVADRLAVTKQLEANLLLVEAAVLINSSDVQHLRQHAHKLLDQQLDMTVELMTIIKASMK